MLLLTTTEFRNNIAKYLDRAFDEKIALKSKRGIIELSPSAEIRTNPSPSGDPWFDDPRNMTEVNKGLAEIDSKPLDEFISWDDFRKTLDL